MSAAFRGHTDVIRVLAGPGADLEAMDKEGAAARIRAAAGGHADAVGVLAELGADLEAKRDYGGPRWAGG